MIVDIDGLLYLLFSVHFILFIVVNYFLRLKISLLELLTKSANRHIETGLFLSGVVLVFKHDQFDLFLVFSCCLLFLIGKVFELLTESYILAITVSNSGLKEIILLDQAYYFSIRLFLYVTAELLRIIEQFLV